MPMFRSATTHVGLTGTIAKARQQRGKGDNRRQSKDHAIGEARDPVLFKEHLDHVGDQLQRNRPSRRGLGP